MTMEELSTWFDQWVTCPVCGDTYGRDSAGCTRCARVEFEDGGHYGYFNSTQGWICYSGCPICYPREED